MWLVVLKVSSTGVQHPAFSKHSLYVAQTSSDLTVVCRVCDRLVQVCDTISISFICESAEKIGPATRAVIYFVCLCLFGLIFDAHYNFIFFLWYSCGWVTCNLQEKVSKYLSLIFFYCELENIKVSKPHLFVSMRLSLRVGLRKGSFFLLKSPGDRCSYSFLHMLLPLLFLYLLYVQSIAILFISPPLRHRRPGRQHRQRVERSNLCTWPTGFQCWGPTDGPLRVADGQEV